MIAMEKMAEAQEQIKGRGRGRPRSFDRDTALDAAMMLFWGKGFDATSVGELTEAMGVTPPSLYAAFGDKEALFLEAVGRYVAHYGSLAVQALGEPGTARAAIERLLRNAARELAEGAHPAGCMVVRAATTCSGLSETARQRLAGMRTASRDAIAARIRMGAEAGELAVGTDVDALADFYASVFQGMSVQAGDGAGEEKLRGVAEAAIRGWPGR